MAALLLLLGAASAAAQPANGGGEDATLQILTSDLARVQTVRAERIEVTFLVVSARAIREVRLNGTTESVPQETVVLLRRTIPLPEAENLIEVAAVDVAGNRRVKSFLVLRDLPERPPEPEDRTEPITRLIEEGQFQQARMELDLWQREGGPPHTVQRLHRLVQRRLDGSYDAAVRRWVHEQQFDRAQQELDAWRLGGGDPAAVAAAREALVSRKRPVLKRRIEARLQNGQIAEAEAILREWEAAGDSPDLVAALRDVIAEWKASPPLYLVLRDIPAASLVQLQLRELNLGAASYLAAETRLEPLEIKTIGRGAGRYRLPGPGQYSVELINAGVHERHLVPFETIPGETVVTLAPDLPYIVEGRWETLPAMPGARAAPAVLRGEGELIVLGGYREHRYVRDQAQPGMYLLPRDVSTYLISDDVYSVADAAWRSNVVTYDEWPDISALFTPIQFDDQLLLVTAKERVWRFRVEPTAEGNYKLSNSGLPWQEKESAIWGMGAPAAVLHQGQVYVAGGLDIIRLPATTEAVEPRLSFLTQRMDPATGEWMNRAPLHFPRGGVAVASVGDSIYLIGGLDAENAYRNEVFRYDPVLNQWHTVTPSTSVEPIGRAWARAAVLNGEIYVIGGEYEGVLGPSVVGRVQIFNPETGAWRDGPDLPTARKDPGVAVLHGDIYVIGGHDGEDPLDVVEVLR